MKKGFSGLAAFDLMLAALLLAVVPVGAQSVDQKIQALEQELSALKEQQMDLKKEATAAAAALPSFSYRPGNGMLIEAADKGWSFRARLEAHVRMYFMEGQDQYGRTNGELELRRWWPRFYYCINNCLWEMEMAFDKDGFGGNSLFQRAAVYAHLENLNPYFPTVWFGGDVSTSIGTIRQGSSATGAQSDYDLVSRSNGFNTGSAGWGSRAGGQSAHGHRYSGKNHRAQPPWCYRRPDALSHCYQLEVGGRKGWRVPSIEELASLVDTSQGSTKTPTLPAGHPFNVLPTPHWSATTNANDSGRAWAVGFATARVQPR